MCRIDKRFNFCVTRFVNYFRLVTGTSDERGMKRGCLKRGNLFARGIIEIIPSRLRFLHLNLDTMTMTTTTTTTTTTMGTNPTPAGGYENVTPIARNDIPLVGHWCMKQLSIDNVSQSRGGYIRGVSQGRGNHLELR